MTVNTIDDRSTFTLRRARGWRWAIGKYAALFQTRLAVSVAYVGEALFRTIFLAMILFILAQLWRTTYAGIGSHRIAGFTVSQMIWYLVMTEAITISRSQVNVEIDDEVRSGGLAYALGRPYHYLLYHTVNHLGERLVRMAVNLLLGGLIALMVVGPIRVTVLCIVATAVATLLAILLDFAGVLCIGLLAFWIEDTRSAALIYSRATMILGGLLMPPAVFPPALARLCEWLPFSAIYYLPGRLLAAGPPENMGVLFVKQVLWLVAGACLALAIYRKGVMRVESHGG